MITDIDILDLLPWLYIDRLGSSCPIFCTANFLNREGSGVLLRYSSNSSEVRNPYTILQLSRLTVIIVSRNCLAGLTLTPSFTVLFVITSSSHSCAISSESSLYRPTPGFNDYSHFKLVLSLLGVLCS